MSMVVILHERLLLAASTGAGPGSAAATGVVLGMPIGGDPTWNDDGHSDRSGSCWASAPAWSSASGSGSSSPRVLSYTYQGSA